MRSHSAKDIDNGVNLLLIDIIDINNHTSEVLLEVLLNDAELLSNNIPNKYVYYVQIGTGKLPSGLELPGYGFVNIRAVIIDEGQPIAKLLSSKINFNYSGQARISFGTHIVASSKGIGISDPSIANDSLGKVMVKISNYLFEHFLTMDTFMLWWIWTRNLQPISNRFTPRHEMVKIPVFFWL